MRKEIDDTRTACRFEVRQRDSDANQRVVGLVAGDLFKHTAWVASTKKVYGVPLQPADLVLIARFRRSNFGRPVSAILLILLLSQEVPLCCYPSD